MLHFMDAQRAVQKPPGAAVSTAIARSSPSWLSTATVSSSSRISSTDRTRAPEFPVTCVLQEFCLEKVCFKDTLQRRMNRLLLSSGLIIAV